MVYRGIIALEVKSPLYKPAS